MLTASIGESLSLLGVSSVELFYLHGPDASTPIEETMDAVNELYKQGKFKRFGLSNFSPEDTEKVYRYAQSKSYVLPSVYQGNYNAFARKNEAKLIPLLRELDIPFYAYSPIAGGFLAKTSDELLANKVFRFDKTSSIGAIYHKMYVKEPLLKGLDQWGKIANSLGITRASLAYRWIAHHSVLNGALGDGVIIGSRSAEQLTQTLDDIAEGPLPQEAVVKIDAIWDSI